MAPNPLACIFLQGGNMGEKCEYHDTVMQEIRHDIVKVRESNERIERALVGSIINKEPGLIEDVRNLKRYASAAKWLVGICISTIAGVIGWHFKK